MVLTPIQLPEIDATGEVPDAVPETSYVGNHNDYHARLNKTASTDDTMNH